MSINQYPQCLVDELAKYQRKPTGNLEWDRAVLQKAKQDKSSLSEPWAMLSKVALQAKKEIENTSVAASSFEDPEVYAAHSQFLMFVANEIVLRPQRRKFVVDDDNRDILRFLLYYFNGSPLCEDVFPGRGYKLHKNLLIQGGVGVGKTMLMQIFSEYLRRIGSPRFFYNVSVTQMVNYYTIHNNLDRFTYYEEGSVGFQCKPQNICLNDIGLSDRTFFGMNTGLLTDEFLHARNEIWTQYGMCAHLTTNLSIEDIEKRFNRNDTYGRLVDRFKTYNVIPLTGKSRR